MSEKEFKELFNTRYNSFCNYACTILKDKEAAEDVVQEVFIDFWKRHGNTQISFPVENYLVRAVKYKCIDVVRKQTVRREYVSENLSLNKDEVQQEDLKPDDTDLQLVINLAIQDLPEKTREVFILCKINKLTYKDIAVKLAISEKTVENQMARAFKQLRLKLKDHRFFEILIIFFLTR